MVWLWKVLIAIQFLTFMDLCQTEKAFSVATYNLWNIMFNWDVRKLRIAQMIKQLQPDVIGFQEVRANAEDGQNQMMELQQMLPQYKWSAFEVSTTVSPLKYIYQRGWEKEGIGLLSKIPIIKTDVYNMTYQYGADTNRRVVLHAELSVSDQLTLHVALTHFTYDRYQQCQNALQLLKYVSELSAQNVIILGDFNVYTDFDAPMNLLLGSHFPKQMRCLLKPHEKALVKEVDYVLRDAWKELFPNRKGYTFSNMPEPGMHSRPDRVFLTAEFEVEEAVLMGDGRVYIDKYYYHLLGSRIKSVLASMYDAFVGREGRSCIYDCGPHASCRCGVCVSGGDTNACELPSCDECTPATFFCIIIFLTIYSLLLIQLLYTALRALLIMNKGSPALLPKMCGNCCLCNPELYSQVSDTVKRSRQKIICRLWPLCRRPPFVTAIVTVIMLFITCQLFLYIYKDVIDDITSIIPEERYPSDHLILLVRVKMKELVT